MTLWQKLREKNHTTQGEDRALILTMASSVIGGSIPVTGKLALSAFHPFTASWIRFLIASLILLPVVYRRRGLSWRVFRTVWPVALLGALNPIILFIALQFTQAAFAPLIYACVPSLVALYAISVEKQRFSAQKVIGIVVGLLGVGAVVLLPLWTIGSVTVSVLGNSLIFLGALLVAAYLISSKYAQAQLGVTPLILTFYFCVVAVGLCSLLAVPELYYFDLPSSLTLAQVLSVVWVGVGTSSFYLLFQKALKHGSALTVSLSAYVQPISGVLLAALVLGETITLPFIIGGSIALIGAGLASKR